MWIENIGLFNTDNFEALKIKKDTTGYALVGINGGKETYIQRFEDIEVVIDNLNLIKRGLSKGCPICSIP